MLKIPIPSVLSVTTPEGAEGTLVGAPGSKEIRLRAESSDRRTKVVAIFATTLDDELRLTIEDVPKDVLILGEQGIP